MLIKQHKQRQGYTECVCSMFVVVCISKILKMTEITTSYQINTPQIVCVVLLSTDDLNANINENKG